MNNALKKRSPKERVTVVMAPFEQYSTFPGAVDTLYQNTDTPFNLIVVEGNAPDAIKSALEKRTQFHKNFKIIYTNHLPLIGEAYNLARPHLKTPWVFFMHNDLRVTAGWLSKLIDFANARNAEIVCPVIEGADDPVRYPNNRFSPKGLNGINTHGFLISKEALEKLGGFEEPLSVFVGGLDLGLRAKNHDIPVFIDTHTLLKRDFPPSKRSPDLLLFKRQWDKERAKRSFAHFRKKWGLELDERSYFEWLEVKQEEPVQVSRQLLKGLGNDLQSKVGFVRMSVRRLLDTFMSL